VDKGDEAEEEKEEGEDGKEERDEEEGRCLSKPRREGLWPGKGERERWDCEGGSEGGGK
jgi:hypothetical protein